MCSLKTRATPLQNVFCRLARTIAHVLLKDRNLLAQPQTVLSMACGTQYLDNGVGFLFTIKHVLGKWSVVTSGPIRAGKHRQHSETQRWGVMERTFIQNAGMGNNVQDAQDE